MCGKDSAISTFNPEDLDRDIYIRQVSGLGYRGGFSFGPDESVLGDEIYTPKVMDRCIDLLKLFMECDIVTSRKLAEELKMGEPLQGTDKFVSYEDIVSALFQVNTALENQVSKLRLELFELIKAIPSPIENMFNPVSAGTSIFISGTSENVDFYKEMLDIAKKRYNNKEHYGGEEKIRSIWPYMVTFFDISLCEWLDRELGMSILFDIFNYNFSGPVDTKSDLDTMFYGMAKRGMEWPMVKQSAEFYYPFIEDCVRMAKDFSADCFIYTQSLACKQFGSVPQLLREVLLEELGIPMLTIDFDVGDARMTSLKTFKEKISMFVQTLL